MYRQFLSDAKVINPNVRLIGLTATPYRLKGGAICGPNNLLNAICYEVGVKELIGQGYLCPLKTKAGRSKADTTGLHLRGGGVRRFGSRGPGEPGRSGLGRLP